MTQEQIVSITAVIAVTLAFFATLLLFNKGVPTGPSMKKKRKYQRQAIEYFHNRIGMKLKMYDETCALCEIVKRHPELKQDVEEYIEVRNEYYGIDYDLTNVSGGKEDGKI